MPSTRSLGAIPKKSRNNQSDLRKPPKSESDKCSMCRSRPENQLEEKRRNRSLKENKVTQTFRQSDTPSPIEGLECIISTPKQSRSRTNARSKWFTPRKLIYTRGYNFLVLFFLFNISYVPNSEWYLKVTVLM